MRRGDLAARRCLERHAACDELGEHSRNKGPLSATPHATSYLVPRNSALIVIPIGQKRTFLSNHGHVLVCIVRDPDIRVGDIAQAVGLTERAVRS